MKETPLDLIFQHVQSPGEFLLRIFEKSVKKFNQNRDGRMDETEDNIETDKGKRFSFDYSVLNPRSGGVRGEANTANCVLSNLMLNIRQNSDESQKLLSHPLVESFVILKWKKVQNWFFAQYLITFICIFAYTVFSSVKCLR